MWIAAAVSGILANQTWVEYRYDAPHHRRRRIS